MKTFSKLQKPLVIAICGPTAVGKTSLSIELAKELGTEILSFDSRQFFKELNIGTAKPSKEELNAVPHHFINNKTIQEEYNASKFEQEALQFLDDYFEKNKLAILVGGSGMYINALLDGFDKDLPSADPEIRKELNLLFETEGISALQELLAELDPVHFHNIDQHNPKRLLRAIEVCQLTNKPYSSFRKGEKQERVFDAIKIGLDRPREELYKRINWRVDLMIEEGLEEEVSSLLPFKDHNALKTVGYKEWWPYFEQKTSKKEVVEKIKVNSRRYAKRQLTWFKKDEEITWFNPSDKLEVLAYIRNRLNARESS